MTTKAKKSAKTVPTVVNFAGVVGEMQISLAPPAVRKAKSAAVKLARLAMTVKFGSVTVEVIAPRKAEVKRNIQAGQSALARAKTKLVKHGVKIKAAKGVPLFHADPELPGQLIRELNGKRERGVFENGKFKACR